MEIPRHWRLKAQRYRLEGVLCPVCGQPAFPPRPICLHCSARPAQILDGIPASLPASICIPDFQPQQRYQFNESLTG